MKVSVIIPCYNTAPYIEECLVSVRKQTLKDIEIICIDDGSTDETLKIIREFSKNDSRIIVHSQKNKGVGPARNKGISMAKGEYLCFLDPDDFYPTLDILEKSYAKAKEHNALICGGEFIEFNHVSKERRTDFHADKFLYGYNFDQEGFIKFEDYQFEFGYHRFLYNTKFIKNNKILFPSLIRHQDPPFFIKAMSLAKCFYALPYPTYLLRLNHKRINWTEARVRDNLEGILLDLKLSKQYKKLNNLVCERLLYNYKNAMLSQISKRNIRKLLYKIYYQIDDKYKDVFEKEFLNKCTLTIIRIYGCKLITIEQYELKKYVYLFGFIKILSIKGGRG